MRALLLVVVFAAAGCSSPPTGLSAELPGTAWTLERIVRADGQVERGSGERISFDPDGSVLIASCNTCNGTFRMRGNELAIRGPMACTKRACMDAEIELETYFGGELTLRRDGSYLIVESMAPESQLLFLPASESVSSSPAGR